MFAVVVPTALILVPAVGLSMILAVPMFLAFLCLALGVGWLVSTATVFFRDVEHLVAVLFLPWFFLTPILYSLDTLPRAEGHPLIIHLLRYGNPVTPYIEGIRGCSCRVTFLGFRCSFTSSSSGHSSPRSAQVSSSVSKAASRSRSRWRSRRSRRGEFARVTSAASSP
jgi:hypothetical protein